MLVTTPFLSISATDFCGDHPDSVAGKICGRPATVQAAITDSRTPAKKAGGRI
jgi:hypothetical protein